MWMAWPNFAVWGAWRTVGVRRWWVRVASIAEVRGWSEIVCIGRAGRQPWIGDVACCPLPSVAMVPYPGSVPLWQGARRRGWKVTRYGHCVTYAPDG